jgi:predicted metalloprotease
MLWESGRRSGNIEDRRGMGIGGLSGIGGIIVFIIALFTGIDPSQLMSMVSQSGVSGQQQVPTSQPADPQADFVSVVLADTEDTWTELFRQAGARYDPPRLVLFTNATQSGCGTGQAAMGPFYCSLDRKVYLDLTFFRELDRRFGAPGDFARAYVVAHEVGHHVQNLMGIAQKVQAGQSRGNPAQSNALQVRMELQADCFAGVWANHANRTRKILEQGDIEEGLRAAAAIGDDTLQRRSQGHVTPETWTHGSSEQRVRWFKQGLSAGTVGACDTFNARS